MKERLQREHAGVSRQKLKRKLLDELDARHKFTPPPSLVEDEFDNVWKTIDDDLAGAEAAPSPTRARPKTRRSEEYRAIAERRVRLGLVIAEIGERNKIKVTDEELTPRGDGARAPDARPASSRSGTTTARIRRRSRACARRSSRTRSSTTSSSSPR